MDLARRFGRLRRRKADFYPVGPLDSRRNFQRFYRIKEDGTVVEHVHLRVPDPRHREELICFHYLSHLTRVFLNAEIGVNVVGRDCPWDFKLELSTGDELFVEVTSIADNERRFIINTREERFMRGASKPRIPLHELRKLAVLFPDEEVSNAVQRYEDQALAATDVVDNPLWGSDTQLFMSTMSDPAVPLDEQLRTAIEKKMAKPHGGKESTVLIIDNRTSCFGIEEWRAAAQVVGPYCEATPFKEIWFYTGYFSDDDGNNAEYSFSPLKVSRSQAEVICALPYDSKGRHFF